MRSNPSAAGWTAALLSIAMLGVVSASCGRSESREDATSTPAPPAATMDSPESDTLLTDAGIEAIVVAANTAEIENAELIRSMTNNDAVRTFAGEMLNAHKAMNADAQNLAAKIGIPPLDDATSRQLAASSDAARTSLKALTGPDLDRSYINGAVADHEAVLEMLDHRLIPHAMNSDLVAMLQSARPQVAEHLEHAKKVQAALP